ncbi:MAG: CXXX repeat peptide maturase [Treponema sp.]|jgi:CXXX repeat peptide maturase|nr:CXXX repeat peptide maturase [Treponema sp.]
MLKYINVLLADTAVSFCHYENTNAGRNKWITTELLNNIIRYCQTQKLSINYIFPKDTVPAELLELIEKTGHFKIASREVSVNATAVVLKPSDLEKLNWLDTSNKKIIILRVNKTEVKNLHKLLERLVNKFVKITLVLTDIEFYTEEDIEAYKQELEKSEECLFQQYKDVKDSLPEINFISDLWFARQMNNCNAGIDHYTFAPDGKFYICPAFYHNGSKSIGDLSEIQVKNSHLFSLEFAPLCSRCDAFHCKRCVYLNHLLTEEFNTPSSQQCRLAHIERECSRQLLERLKQANPLFLQILPIKIINYNDPMEKILRNEYENTRRAL